MRNTRGERERPVPERLSSPRFSAMRHRCGRLSAYMPAGIATNVRRDHLMNGWQFFIARRKKCATAVCSASSKEPFALDGDPCDPAYADDEERGLRRFDGSQRILEALGTVLVVPVCDRTTA